MGWKYKLDDGEVEIQVSKEVLLSALTASKAVLSDYAVGIEPAPQSVSFAVWAVLSTIDTAIKVVERDYVPAVPDKATIAKFNQHVQSMTTQHVQDTTTQHVQVVTTQQKNTGWEGS